MFSAYALPSLPPEALPPRVRHLPVAVKRAKSGKHDLADLQREVSVLQQYCSSATIHTYCHYSDTTWSLSRRASSSR